ncbi:MAG: glycosyltransferase family 39 protein [archaeon]
MRPSRKKPLKVLDRYFSVFLNSNRLVFLFFLLLVFASKYPTSGVPLHWDEQGYVSRAIMARNNNYNPFMDVWAYHPPMMPMLGALAYGFFGYTVSINRIIIAVFSVIALYYLYAIGSHTYSREVGIIASIMLWASPIFFIQSGFFLAEVPFTALSLATIFFYLKNKRTAYIVTASIMMLTKEPAVFVISSICAYELFCLSKNRCSLMPRLAFLASPLLVFFAWMVLNKAIMGWYLCPDHMSAFQIIPAEIWARLKHILMITFWIQHRYANLAIIFAGLAIALVSRKVRSALLRKEMLLYLILAISLAGFFSFLTVESFLARYILILHPFFYLFTAATICGLSRFNLLRFLMVLVIVALSISAWFGTQIVPSGEISFSHLSFIRLHHKAASIIESNYSDYRIFAAWPELSTLKDPSFGYVNKSMETAGPEAAVNAEGDVLIVYSKNIQRLKSQGLRRLAYDLRERVERIIQVKNHQDTIYIYVVPKTGS